MRRRDGEPAGRQADWVLLRRHLVGARLAGKVQTSPADTMGKCSRLVGGDEAVTFGLTDWREVGLGEVVEAVRSLCGGGLPAPDGGRPGPAERATAEAAHGTGGPEGPGWIDPDATLAAIARHRDRLAVIAGEGGARVLVSTGHPTGLLPHYQALARALQSTGSMLLTPAQERPLGRGGDGRRREIRYLDGVGCVSDGASLRHTHRSAYMEAMLDELGGGYDAVELVVADHGFAGAAIERGIPTLAIADVNDAALALAQARGRTDAVLPIDDNLAPRLFVPVTSAMLDW